MAHIITVPNPILRQVAKPVEKLDKKALQVIADMESTLKAAKDPQGVGLAAPQIGVALRIFMIRPKTNSPVQTFINPEILKYSQRKTKPTGKHGVYEGCLSIPQHYAPVTRSSSVTIKYQTPKLTTKQETLSGFPAHIVQHEMDHLNGILFLDHVLSQNSKLYKITSKDKWEEIGL